MNSARPVTTARNIASKHLALVIVVMALIVPCSLLAQSYRGSIRGRVVDPQGSIIAGAKITAKNSATGQVRETITGADGAYVLAELPAGQYVVVAESAGLSPVAQNVVVNVGLDTTANFDLTKVQQRIEQVTVSTSAPLVDDTRDVLGEVVNQRLVTDLPLNGRDFGKLVALVPGATVEPSGVAAIQSGFGQFSINGNRDRSNNYTLDGTDNNDPFFNNSAFNQVGIGGAPASVLPIDSIQEFNLESHFSAEYGRNSGSVVNIITKSGSNQLHGSAFEFLRNDALDARNFFNRDPAPKSAFRNNQFGGSIGGPIIKDKTFFFGAYEGQRERVTSDFSLVVPTPQQIADGQALAAGNEVTPSPVLTSILGLYPAATNSAGIVPGSVRDKNDVDSLIAKVDHQISSSESLSGRYAFARSEQVFPLGGLGFGAGSRLPQFAQTSPTRVQLVSISLLSTLSPRKINEVRFGYSRYRTSFSSLDANFDPSTLGINFGTGKLSLPEIDFGGVFDNLGATAFSIPRGRTSQSFQILDNFTWLSGRHTFKFGGEFRRAAIENFNDNLERGLFTFSPDMSGLALCTSETPDPRCNDSGALVLANFYLGNSFTLANSGNTHRNTFNNGLSFFAQDDIRVRPNLTLNLGLRWEYFGPISEQHNLLSNLGQDGNLALVGTDGVNGAYQRDLNNFGPRVGFAWNVHPKTVLRGAYGIYYDYIPQDLLIANFTSSAGLVTNPIGSEPVVPFNFDQNAFVAPSLSTPILIAPTPPFSGASIFVTPRNLATPYVQNWNFNFEQELSNSVALQIGYVGGKGTKLARLRDANQPDVNGNRNNFPQYGAVDQFTTVAASTYHALQATLRTRSWYGLSGFAGYTWSKSLDDASDAIDFNFATVAFPQDSNNLHAEHGPSNFDTRHRVTAAFTYELPKFGGPRRLAEGWQVNTIITAQSGRPVPIVSANDTSGLNGNSVSNFHQRPNVVPGVNPINSNWRSGPDSIGYLNGNAFSQPPDGTFGNLGRNAIFGPSFFNLDFAVTKNTQIFERVNLQLRAEFFNILNHPNFALPNFFVDPGSPQQGLITQTPDQAQTNPGLGGGGPRVIQFGAKFTF
ncbi:MAG: carboxypeptidase regulatory-like domain-containing protein [Acidobacteriia bacterium]|nr:carboxypeptidase regulatory-like domain-containing protein [Terriglobia bacterium]